MGFAPDGKYGFEDSEALDPPLDEGNAPVQPGLNTTEQRDKEIADLIARYTSLREAWLEDRIRVRKEINSGKTAALEQQLAVIEGHLHSYSSDIAALKDIRYARNPDGTPVPIPLGQLKHASQEDVSQPKPLRKGGESLSPKSVRSYVPLGVKQDIPIGEMESAGNNPTAEVSAMPLEPRASVSHSDLDDEIDTAFERLEQPGESTESKLDGDTIYAELAQKRHVEMNAVTHRLRKGGLSKEECKVHPDYLIAYGAWRELRDHNLAVSRRKNAERERQIAAASAVEHRALEETIATRAESTGPESVWDMPTEPETEREESDLVLPGWDGTLVPTSVPAVHAEKPAPRTFFPAGIPDTILRQAIEDLEQKVAFLDEQVSKHRHDRALHFSFMKERKKVLDMLKLKRAELRDLEQGEVYGPSAPSQEQLVALRNRSAAEQLERIGYVPQSPFSALTPKVIAPAPVVAPIVTSRPSLPLNQRRELARRYRPLVAVALVGAMALSVLAKLRADTPKSENVPSPAVAADTIKPEQIAPVVEPVIEEEVVLAHENFPEVSLASTESDVAGADALAAMGEYEVAAQSAAQRKKDIQRQEAVAQKQERSRIETVSPGKLISPLDTDDLMLQRGLIDRVHKDDHEGVDLMPGNRSATAKVRAVTDSTVTAVLGAKPTKAKKTNPDARAGNGCGNGIILTDADGNTDTLCHLQSVPTLRVGDTIVAGAVVGNMGRSGNAEGVHVHWKREGRDGKLINPLTQLDPRVRIVNLDNEQVFPLDGTQVAHDHRGRLIFTESDIASMRTQTSERIAQVIAPQAKPEVTIAGAASASTRAQVNNSSDMLSFVGSAEVAASRTLFMYGPTTLKHIAQGLGLGKSAMEKDKFLSELLRLNPGLSSTETLIRNRDITIPELAYTIRAVAQVENTANPGM